MDEMVNNGPLHACIKQANAFFFALRCGICLDQRQNNLYH